MSTSRLRGERGQGIIEFAVIFPIFVLLIFVVVDGALVMGRYNNINHAANEGARLLAVSDDAAGVTDARNQVKNQVHGLLNSAGDCGSGPPEICFQWVDGPAGEPAGQVGSAVKVTLKYNYSLITPLANKISGGITIEQCAVMRLERPYSAAPSSGGSSAC